MRRDMVFLRNALLLLACIAVFLAVALIIARALGVAELFSRYPGRAAGSRSD